MVTVLLYTRKDCSLCEKAKDVLMKLQQSIPHQLIEIDVDKDITLQQAYGTEIPVIEIGPYKIKPPFTDQDIAMTLAAARDRKEQLVGLNDRTYNRMVKRGSIWSKADAITMWFAKHYLMVFNLIVLVYVGIPWLAPILMKNDQVMPAKLIYKTYGFVCHQLAYRSFFIYGQQPFYPRDAANVDGFSTFIESTGLSEDNFQSSLLTAQQFSGNEIIGYKVALCQRDISTYLGILFFGLIFAASKRQLPPLHWLLWILIGIVPIGIDGMSQLLSQPPFGYLPYRESTPYLRVLTGGLFGFITAWFGYPLVEYTMSDTRKILTAKRLRLNNP